MNDEDLFLRKVLENPADDTTRLVYADWLDERGDPESASKAEFLRLTAQFRATQAVEEPSEPRASLRALAANLPTDWLRVVSKLPVDRCGAKVTSERRLAWLRDQFAFVCEREWDEMTPTKSRDVRFCEQCKENVHYCDTIVTAREHARQGHCVAVDLGIIRRPGDLARQVTMRGRISAERVRQLEAQEPLDAVSQEREERKRA